MKPYRLDVLGAGAADRIAAIEVSRRGRRVAVLERAERPAKRYSSPAEAARTPLIFTYRKGATSTALTAVKTTAVAPTFNAIDRRAIPVRARVRQKSHLNISQD